MSASALPGQTQSLERTLNWPRMRPRFTLELGCRAEHVMEVLRRAEAHPESERAEGPEGPAVGRPRYRDMLRSITPTCRSVSF